jgi:hypothetical protein
VVVVVSAAAPLTWFEKKKKSNKNLTSATPCNCQLPRINSLHRTCEPRHLSVIEAAAVLRLDERSGQARSINAFCLTEHTADFNYGSIKHGSKLTIFVRTDVARFSNISMSRRNHSSAVLFHFANLAN